MRVWYSLIYLYERSGQLLCGEELYGVIVKVRRPVRRWWSGPGKQ